MKAVMQFKEYYVIEACYRSAPFFSGNEELEEPKLQYKLELKENDVKEAIVGLGVELGDSSLLKSPFYVGAKVLGLFRIETEKDLSEKEIMKYYKQNAVAILFPYLRSLVTDLTSRGNNAPVVILPTMNIAALINASDKDQPIVSPKD